MTNMISQSIDTTRVLQQRMQSKHSIIYEIYQRMNYFFVCYISSATTNNAANKSILHAKEFFNKADA